jgi:hypothetical protein
VAISTDGRCGGRSLQVDQAGLSSYPDDKSTRLDLDDGRNFNIYAIFIVSGGISARACLEGRRTTGIYLSHSLMRPKADIITGLAFYNRDDWRDAAYSLPRSRWSFPSPDRQSRRGGRLRCLVLQSSLTAVYLVVLGLALVFVSGFYLKKAGLACDTGVVTGSMSAVKRKGVGRW